MGSANTIEKLNLSSKDFRVVYCQKELVMNTSKDRQWSDNMHKSFFKSLLKTAETRHNGIYKKDQVSRESLFENMQTISWKVWDF